LKTALPLALGLAFFSVVPGLSAAEIDAGAVLNRYRQELTPGLPAPAALSGETRLEAFNGFEFVDLPAPAQDVAKAFLLPQLGQQVVQQQLISQLERHLQDAGLPFVFALIPATRPTDLPKLKAYQVAFGKVKVANQSAFDTDMAQRVLSHNMQPGKPVDRIQLERNSTILLEVDGLSSRFQMVPGEHPGVTDLLASLAAGRPFVGSVTVDNSGSDRLGKNILRGDVAINNKLGMGDVFRLYGLRSQYSKMAGFDASYLAASAGWRLGLSLSRFSYGYDVGAEAPVLNNRSTGSASNLGLSAVYPWIRNEYGRHTLSLNFDRGHTLGDATLTTELTSSERNLSNILNTKWNASVYGIQALPKEFSISYQAALSAGKARQDNASAALQDQTSARQMGTYGKLFLTASLSKQLQLGEQIWLGTLNASAQRANVNLPGSEKMYFGGANQMRAWASQAVPVDEAAYAEWKFERLLNAQWRAGVFAEAAHYKQNHSNYLTSVGSTSVATDLSNIGRMADWGLSASYQPRSNTLIKASVARKLTSEPSVNTQTLLDPSRTRGWLSLSYLF
jgi:hemolysin activation/secretion protein